MTPEATPRPRYRCSICGQEKRRSGAMRRAWARQTDEKPLGLACGQWCAVQLLKRALEANRG